MSKGLSIAETPEKEATYNDQVAQLEKINGNINGDFDDITSLCSTLTKDWNSEACNEYVKNIKNSLNSLSTYSAELEKIKNYLADTMAEYKAIENANVQSANQMFDN